MMNYTLDAVYESYLRLYGEDKKDDIIKTIKQARRVAEQTGEDPIPLAESMLSDILD